MRWLDSIKRESAARCHPIRTWNLIPSGWRTFYEGADQGGVGSRGLNLTELKWTSIIGQKKIKGLICSKSHDLATVCKCVEHFKRI